MTTRIITIEGDEPELVARAVDKMIMSLDGVKWAEDLTIEDFKGADDE